MFIIRLKYLSFYLFRIFQINGFSVSIIYYFYPQVGSKFIEDQIRDNTNLRKITTLSPNIWTSTSWRPRYRTDCLLEREDEAGDPPSSKVYGRLKCLQEFNLLEVNHQWQIFSTVLSLSDVYKNLGMFHHPRNIWTETPSVRVRNEFIMPEGKYPIS